MVGVLVGAWLPVGRAQTSGSEPTILEPTPGMADEHEFSFTLLVGQQLSLTFAASSTGTDPRPGQQAVDGKFDPDLWRQDEEWFPHIDAEEDPGMPNGAELRPGEFKKQVFLNDADNKTIQAPEFEYSASFVWVPTCAQTSTYRVHITIYNVAAATTKKLTINVVRPDPQISEYSNQTRFSRVGCPMTLLASARDSSPLVRGTDLPGYAMAWDVSMQRIDVRGHRYAVETLAGSSVEELPGRNEFNGTSAMFRWVPVRGQEGSTFEICFHMQDSCRVAAVQTACTNVTVSKCQLCIHDGHTLQSLAAEYKSDPLTLYSMNVAISNPDRIPHGTLVNAGIKYKVREGDSLFSIAERFFSSVDHILSLNPDIRDDSPGNELLLDDTLCVLPPLCSVRCERGTVCALVEKQHAGISSV